MTIITATWTPAFWELAMAEAMNPTHSPKTMVVIHARIMPTTKGNAYKAAPCSTSMMAPATAYTVEKSTDKSARVVSTLAQSSPGYTSFGVSGSAPSVDGESWFSPAGMKMASTT